MKGCLAALVLLTLLQSAGIIGQACFLATALSGLWAGASWESQVYNVGAFFACFAGARIVAFAQDAMLERYSLTQAESLKHRFLELTFDPDYLIATRIGSGTVVTLATDGIDEVQSYLRIMPPKLTGIVAISLPILVFAFITDWVSGVILLVMLPVMMFFMILLGRQARDRAQRQFGRYRRLSNHFLDTMRGMGTIIDFGAGKSESQLAFRKSEDLRSATVRTLTTATLSSAVLDLVATFGVAAVAMMLAFRLMDGSVALQTALVALMLAPEYFAPIRSFAGDFHASLDGKNALASLLEQLNPANSTEAHDIDRQPRTEIPDENAGDAARRGDNRAHDAAADVQDSHPCVKFDQVDFSYAESGWGIHDASFLVSGPSRVAVIGKSGSGKSTLCSLAAGFLKPDCGTVQTSGHLHYIPQHPHIFKASIADNIRFYAPESPLEDVRRAAYAVGLDEFLAELPDGLETIVGEGAQGVSGGQAHRIALARALLDKSASVLVFDEPTAHLDIETELDLKSRMLPIMEGKLVLFATHRLHWVADMDQVLFVDEGSVVGPLEAREFANRMSTPAPAPQGSQDGDAL